MTTIPGPNFTSRPGWGGQLRHWWSRNAYALIFRAVILIALIFVGRALLLRSAVTVAEQTPIPTPIIRPITLHAKPGQGVAHLAGQALDLYLALQPTNMRLDAAQHLFAIDALTRLTGPRTLERSEGVTFDPLNISAVITDAINLSPTQKAAWSRLVK
jgi:hypothetical protein